MEEGLSTILKVEEEKRALLARYWQGEQL